MPTYYDEHKDERRAYQMAYRNRNLDEIRRKDSERKRVKKREPDVFMIEKNVRVAITDSPRVCEEQPTASLPSRESVGGGSSVSLSQR
jgi:hypothetical protein